MASSWKQAFPVEILYLATYSESRFMQCILLIEQYIRPLQWNPKRLWNYKVLIREVSLISEGENDTYCVQIRVMFFLKGVVLYHLLRRVHLRDVFFLEKIPSVF